MPRLVLPRVCQSRLLPYIVIGGLLISIAMGIRQSFGLFLTPFSFEYGMPITVWALAVALQNLVWGIMQPIAGAVADRHGAPRVIAFGACIYGCGLVLTALVASVSATMIGAGVMIGVGLSCMSFGVILATVGRAASEAQRGNAMGLTAAFGSIGQIIIPPLAQVLIDAWGVGLTFCCLAGVVVLAVPFCGLLGEKGDRRNVVAGPPAHAAGATLHEALTDRNYLLLTIGFFTCGFQLAFITTHLPGYLALCHLPIGLGGAALAAIGFFNMIGSWLCGRAGDVFKPQKVLGWLYLVRAAALCGFLLLPKTPVVVLCFAAVMGFVWLGTVPLTNSVVARRYGLHNLGLLFGGCFFSHQVGSFFGAWLGGLAFELTGSYDAMWVLTAVAGVFAALLHFPIQDRPVLRAASPKAA